MILSSKLRFIDQNTNKTDQLSRVHQAYIELLSFYLDAYWSYFGLDSHDFSKSALKQHKFYPSEILDSQPTTNLSARMISAAKTQVMSMIKSRTSALNKKYFVLAKLQKEQIKNKLEITKLQKQIAYQRKKLSKPHVSNKTPMELASLVFRKTDTNTTKRDAVYEMKSFWSREYKKAHGLSNKINFVLNNHAHLNKLAHLGKEKMSYLVDSTGFWVRFDIKEPKIKKSGRLAAIDQGINFCITMVDDMGNITQSQPNKDGYDLNKILKMMTRKKRGTKNFRDQQAHRTNYVNWAINQLDLTGIRELRVENLRDMTRGKRASRFIVSFPYREIRSKLQRVCQLAGVQLVWQSSMYRSQRCNGCGFVHRDNRSGNKFECLACHYTDQADINAARNHLADITHMGRNPLSRSSGFYWN